MAAVPSIPSNFYLQTGNQQNYLSWDLTNGATSYSVQRSLDGVSYSVVATPTNPSYLDTAVTIGIQYFYKVAAVNGSGTGAYTAPQSIVPTPTAEMSLGQIRLLSQQRADRVNSNFVTVPEWNSYINQSMYELYDMLITAYEDYYLAPPVLFTTQPNIGDYPLPDGILYSGAAPFYKVLGVDLGLQTSNNGYVSVRKFNFIDRNNFVFPNTASTIYGVFNLTYRIMGNLLKFVPIPTSGQPIRLWYIPRLPQLLKDTDLTTLGVSGWLEYVIVDAAIKALQKEESDVSVLVMEKMALKQRIEEAAQNRDAGQPDRISNINQFGPWGFNGPFDGFRGGW